MSRPSTEPYAARLAALRDMRERLALDVLVLSRPSHLRHAVGQVSSGNPSLLVLDGKAVHLLAPEGTSLSPALKGFVECHVYEAYAAGYLVDPVVNLGALLDRDLANFHHVCSAGIEANHLPATLADRLGSARLLDLGHELARLRISKDAAEIAAIRRSVAAVDAAFEEVRTLIRPGAQEIDLLDAVRTSLRESAGDDVELGYNLGSGPRSADPDPHATDRRLMPGDLILLDLYPAIAGHVADLTRTFVVGEPSREQRAHHAALESALETGVNALRPGAVGRDVAAAVHASLSEAVGPLARSMDHHAGHGLGIHAWEAPWIGAASDDELGDPSVVAIEPGLYDPGHWGMRLEGNYLVTSTHVERLDVFPSGMIVCG